LLSKEWLKPDGDGDFRLRRRSRYKQAIQRLAEVDQWISIIEFTFAFSQLGLQPSNDARVHLANA
jgi:hypothetical protein